LQEGEILRARLGEDAARRRLDLLRGVNADEVERARLEALREIASGGVQGGARQGEARPAVGDDAGARIPRSQAPWRHHRHCDHAGDEAAEKRHDEIEPGRKHQKRALAGLSATHELRRKRIGAPLELREGERRLLAAAVGEKDIGALVRLLGSPRAQKLDHRGMRCLENRRVVLHARDSLQSGSPAR
jgi:hypothetical protein